MNCPVTLEEVHITVAQYLFATPVDEANSRAEAGTHSIFYRLHNRPPLTGVCCYLDAELYSFSIAFH